MAAPDDDDLLSPCLEMLAAAQAGEVCHWGDVHAALEKLASAPPSPATEKALLGVLRFEGRIHLTPSSELPHSMSPEEMLKSLSIQVLGKWTGLTHLAEMQRIQTTAVSPVLSGIARAVIRRARQSTDSTEP